MKKHYIYLACGILFTLLFIIFKVNIYEHIYFAQGFSDQFFNLGLYNTVALITAATAWLGAAVYYYVINSVKFDRWYNWLTMLVIVTLLAPILCFWLNDYVFAQNGLMYITESINFELVNLAVTAALFVVASFSIRWWSSNCRHTPIPQ
ncbi:MAG: hypothetical protein J6X81_03190 [Muribaculaceae bacterium]|nr:hypothetical protein [Muribaculaceae bacterium]